MRAARSNGRTFQRSRIRNCRARIWSRLPGGAPGCPAGSRQTRVQDVRHRGASGAPGRVDAATRRDAPRPRGAAETALGLGRIGVDRTASARNRGIRGVAAQVAREASSTSRCATLLCCWASINGRAAGGRVQAGLGRGAPEASSAEAVLTWRPGATPEIDIGGSARHVGTRALKRRAVFAGVLPAGSGIAASGRRPGGAQAASRRSGNAGLIPATESPRAARHKAPRQRGAHADGRRPLPSLQITEPLMSGPT